MNIESKRFFANDKGEIQNEGYTRGSIFTDFNYGDFALVFPNPLVTFQKKETDKMIRDHVETHGPGTLEPTSWVPSFWQAKPQGSREEQNKVARDYAEDTYMKQFHPVLTPMEKNRQSWPLMKFFADWSNFSNIPSTDVNTKYLSDERTAMINALLYYSTWSYEID